MQLKYNERIGSIFWDRLGKERTMAGILEGKVAVVTSGTSGIGEGVVRLFSKEGAKVVFMARRKERGEAIEAEINAAGGDVRYICGDVTKKEDMELLVNTAVKEFGTVNIAIGHAGIGAGGLIHEVEPEDLLDAPVQMNFYANMRLAHLVLPYMIENKGGSIVFTSSNVGTGCGAAMATTYGMTKAGLDNLVKSICMAYGQYNIRANTVRPGVITTELSPAGGFMEKMQVPFIPMHRPGKVEEIAQLYLFLASDLCPYINGEDILCDGGVNCGILFPDPEGFDEAERPM